VRMRVALAILLAAVLGVAAAGLAACGSSDSARRKFIPQRSADRLKSELTDVRQAVDDGDCEGAASAISQARTRVGSLPPAVDDQIVKSLRDGLDNLATVAQRECQEHATPTTTEEDTSETTTPETTTPETTTTDTTTTPTTATTDTTTTATTPTTDTGATTPPATTPPTAPPGDTTGGTTTP
jgi:hypothetical protein